MLSPTLRLWLSLVVPSLYIVQKYTGWEGAVTYATVAAVGVTAAAHLPMPRRNRTIVCLAAATFALVTVTFLLVYPIVNVHAVGLGSDDDDAYNAGARAMFAGRSPYTQTTYLGNALHQLPGAFILAAPFVLAGPSALQNLFWLPMFFFAVNKEAPSGGAALRLAWIVLAFSPTVMHQVVTGTGHVSNTIYVLVGLWWLLRTTHGDLSAVAWGVALASRANFLLLVPLAFGWLRQHHGWQVALRRTALTCGTVACVTLPFYFSDPAHFGPMEAAERLVRFNTLIPHAGESMAVLMGALAVGLSFTPMDKERLFRNCALVQAFPVVMGTILGAVQTGGVDLSFAAYGTFAAWFMFMAAATSDSNPFGGRIETA